MKTKLCNPIAEVRKTREELLAEHSHDLRSLASALNAAAKAAGSAKKAPIRKARTGEKYWGRTSAAHRKAALVAL
jgi:hypothetical protein